jgi:hypothetical protein
MARKRKAVGLFVGGLRLRILLGHPSYILLPLDRLDDPAVQEPLRQDVGGVALVQKASSNFTVPSLPIDSRPYQAKRT